VDLRGTISKHRPSAVLAVLVTVCLVLLVLSTRQETERPGLFHSLLSAGQELTFRVRRGVVSTITSVRELGELRQDYLELVEQLRSFEAGAADLAELERENARLREQLGYAESLPASTISAQIVGKDPSNHFSTITLNKGSSAGIERDMAVIAIQNGRQGLVGKVVEVGSNYAQVMPLFDSSLFVAARLQESRHEGLVQGGGPAGRRIVMRFVAATARSNVGYGDIVVTSGMNSFYPRGIVIGTVLEVQARPYESSLELLVEPAIDFGRLEYVFVVGPSFER
jgi:rod shape-determining protein MreC